MIYTLAKFFIWGLGFAVIGGIIGWLLRSVRADSDGTNSALDASADEAENERLRHRVATLEVVAAERDRLAAQLVSCQDDVAKAKAFAKEANASVASSASDVTTAFTSQMPLVGQPVATPPTAPTAPAPAPLAPATSAPIPAQSLAAPAPPAAPMTPAAPAASAPVTAPASFAGLARADLDAARAVFGRAVKMDDLELIEGIGPKIAELLTNAGILTWSDLAHSQIGSIRSILEGAGERFRLHDPTTWPRQAGLAARGRWEELKTLQEALDGGRE